MCCRIGTHSEDARFMLFIDGLDEYEEDRMAASDLIETVKKLGRAPNFKVCVSSRPWGVFLDAFGNQPSLTLRLEDLTRNDIRCYITDKFCENRQYRRLEDVDTAYSNLVEEVCKRAQGVFLWVYLVVRDLLDGLVNADSVSFLFKRLDAFPQELEEFFQHMIDTISTIYRAQTARIFDIAKSAPEPQSMIAYSFVDEVEEKPESIHQMAIVPMTDSEIRRREDQLRRQLYARCMGLLEIASDEESETLYYQLKVNFLHRTVSEFLHRSTQLAGLLGQSRGTNSSAVVMSRALVAKLKNASPFELESGDELSGPQRMVENLLNFVSQIIQIDADSAEPMEILGAAEKVFRGQRPQQNSGGSNGLRRHGLSPSKNSFHEQEMEIVGFSNESVFIGMCCRKGLSTYVASRLYDPGLRSAAPRPLLDYALDYRDAFVHPGTVRVLLEQGEDPNQGSGGRTSWQRFICR